MAPVVTDLCRGRRVLTRFALVCLWGGMLAGLVASLLYTELMPVLRVWGLSLRSLRPLHLTAGTGWIYLAGLSVVVHHWSRVVQEQGGRRRILRAVRFFAATWLLGALVVSVSLLWARFSGREYFFISTPASALFWLGWVGLAWMYLRHGVEGGLWGLGRLGEQPIYRWMWLSSFGIFTYAFVETHAFLLPYMQGHPLRDMAVEWKSYGTLVGSFNLLVYGSLAYLGEQLGGKAARSRMTFALFWVGVLNSFTNYGHHTYHLPQSALVHWTSFIISMTEIVILAKVVWDVFGWSRRMRRERGKKGGWDAVTWLLFATSFWTFASLIVSMLISVPPFNSVIHGTLVVAGHAMGSMLGIDTVGMLAVLAWLWSRDTGASLPRWPVLVMNLGIALLWAMFLFIGMDDALRRWNYGILPSASLWPGWFGHVFVTGGLMVATGVVGLTWRWLLPLSALPPRSALAHEAAR